MGQFSQLLLAGFLQPEEREAFTHFPPRSLPHLVAQRDILLNKYAADNPVRWRFLWQLAVLLLQESQALRCLPCSACLRALPVSPSAHMFSWFLASATSARRAARRTATSELWLCLLVGRAGCGAGRAVPVLHTHADVCDPRDAHAEPAVGGTVWCKAWVLAGSRWVGKGCLRLGAAAATMQACSWLLQVSPLLKLEVVRDSMSWYRASWPGRASSLPWQCNTRNLPSAGMPPEPCSGSC